MVLTRFKFVWFWSIKLPYISLNKINRISIILIYDWQAFFIINQLRIIKYSYLTFANYRNLIFINIWFLWYIFIEFYIEHLVLFFIKIIIIKYSK